MTEEELREIEERCERATGGPWEWSENCDYAITGEAVAWNEVNRPGRRPVVTLDYNEHDDAVFIAHARTDIPALVAEVRRLKSEASMAEQRERKRCDDIVMECRGQGETDLRSVMWRIRSGYIPGEDND